MREMGVARRLGDEAVKDQIGLNGVARALDGLAHPGDGVAHALDMMDLPALRGEGGGLDLDADAQLQHLDHVMQQFQVHDAGLQRHRRRLAHEGADALLRGDEARRLEAGDRLAHDRAADGERLDQVLLGGQPVAGLQVAVIDAGGKRAHELGGQRLPAMERCRRLVLFARRRLHNLFYHQKICLTTTSHS
jgi:hypothetical protein